MSTNGVVLNSNLQTKRLPSLATLTETLGGVVQRFPGLSTGLQNIHSAPSTPPLGCYSLNSVNRSPFINTPTKIESPITPEQLLIHPFYMGRFTFLINSPFFTYEKYYRDKYMHILFSFLHTLSFHKVV